jgi:hypothetical protein
VGAQRRWQETRIAHVCCKDEARDEGLREAKRMSVECGPMRRGPLSSLFYLLCTEKKPPIDMAERKNGRRGAQTAEVYGTGMSKSMR